MPLSWNEIKDRALKFSQDWADTHNEEADAKPFLDAFFNVFGISRKKIGTFEHKVKKIDDANGYIDLLWKGVILIEMKSRGKNLDKAFEQAIAYTHNLKEHELPRYILVCDFHEFRLYDTSEQSTHCFTIDQFIDHVGQFGFIAGYEKKTYKEQDPVNVKAAEHMGRLHDALKTIGYTGHPLEVYLVRILFCLFAEDTTIFEKQQFQDYIEQRTSDDGSDLAARIAELFQVLNTPQDTRYTNLDEQLAAFPYVNGKLFEETLPTASFDAKMRRALLECCYIDWSLISPAIFGSMFQSVMNPIERRNLGAHYTSEQNILKLIKPLFLDALWDEYHSIIKGKNKTQVTAALNQFHEKLARQNYLDPACGCGNFLVITYRELRLLELEVIKHLHAKDQLLDIDTMVRLNVDIMHGIEYEEFPARIAEVAMWLIDHQMNMLVSAEFGQYYVRLPLRRAAHIIHGDALSTDWESVVAKDKLSYILGNPPFIGSKMMTQPQRDTIVDIFKGVKGAGVLDYVTGWYAKAAAYIQGTRIKAAFVSTNSIVQGEQTSILWSHMMNQLGVTIHFAHRSFKWRNEARGNAAVYCVIIGFANFDVDKKTIFDYEDIKGEAHEVEAKNINSYLVDAQNIFVESRSNPICKVPEIKIGNKPIDGGFYLFTTEEKNDFLKIEPKAEKWFRRWLGSHEFINGYERWCLLLRDCPPAELRSMPEAMKRIEAVKQVRLSSKSAPTQKLAEAPTRFHVENMPNSNYLILPETSSENRTYIPIGFETPETLSSNLVKVIADATLYHFGVLTSMMHMAWVKTTCGRLKSDYRYSKDIVYNNYPWPQNPTDKHRAAIEAAAQAVLDARAAHPDASLADLYDPLTMPANLRQAHNALDKAVDAAYAFKGNTDTERMALLFAQYQQLISDLATTTPAPKTKKSRSQK